VNTGTPNSPTKWGIDLQSEHERYLTEKYAKKPVIVMNYPKAIKAFYMRVNDDGVNAETDHRHRHAWRQRDRV
jgi:aspartyl/asparaginyl-tRNA synthetase